MSGVDRISYFPLSFGQLAMMRRMAEVPAGGAQANIVRRYDLDPPVPVSTVRMALHELSQRHSALRTIIDLEHSGGPAQRVYSNPALPISVCRHSDFTDVIDSLRKVDLHTAHDLMWRAVVHASAGDATGLGVAVHHAICDARAIEVLGKSLLALIAGHREASSRKTLDAAELAVRQRARGTEERTLRYFAKIYRSLPPVRSDLQGTVTGGRRYSVRFSLLSATGLVRRTADACGVSSHSVMLAISVLLFSGWSGCTSGAFNVFGENRALPELRETIDCLTQDVPFIYDFRRDESFADLSGRVHRSAMRAYAVGPWDVEGVGELRAEIERERHVSLGISQDFNYLVTPSGPTDAAALGHQNQPQHPTVEVVEGHDTVFSVRVTDREDIQIAITAAPELADSHEMARLGKVFEECLSLTSANASVPIGRLLHVIAGPEGQRPLAPGQPRFRAH